MILQSNLSTKSTLWKIKTWSVKPGGLCSQITLENLFFVPVNCTTQLKVFSHVICIHWKSLAKVGLYLVRTLMKKKRVKYLIWCIAGGELTTHSTFNINYEILSTTSFTLTIYVNDGKKQVSETFTATVTNVNEAPYFLASEYTVTQLEANVSNTVQCVM